MDEREVREMGRGKNSAARSVPAWVAIVLYEKVLSGERRKDQRKMGQIDPHCTIEMRQMGGVGC